MEQIIEYFNNISSAHRSIILFGGLTLFMLIETGIPLFKFDFNRWKHLGLNLFFTFTTILVNFLMAFILINTSIWVTDNAFGIIHWISSFRSEPNVWISLIVGMLIMDFISAWFAHWASHKVRWMWRFHIIHHSDMNIDASSANRHHPGESVIRFSFTVLAVLLVGAPIWLVMLYQACSAFLSQFNHSNIKMPKWLDDTLMWVICTPNMHRVHHHYRQPYSDSNYGNIFSFWDRIFKTFKRVKNQKLRYGLDTHPEVHEVTNVISLLKIPFQTYRPEIRYADDENLED